jgi:hypothetical protein
VKVVDFNDIISNFIVTAYSNGKAANSYKAEIKFREEHKQLFDVKLTFGSPARANGI